MEENCATGDIEIDKLSDALDSVLEDQKVEAEAGCVAVEPKCHNWTRQSIYKAPIFSGCPLSVLIIYEYSQIRANDGICCFLW